MFCSGGAGEEVPDEPGGGGPEKEGRGDFDEADFDVGGKDEESKNREQLARSGAIGAIEKRWYDQALVVEP